MNVSRTNDERDGGLTKRLYNSVWVCGLHTFFNYKQEQGCIERCGYGYDYNDDMMITRFLLILLGVKNNAVEIN
jgi:hypothetical protein